MAIDSRTVDELERELSEFPDWMDAVVRGGDSQTYHILEVRRELRDAGAPCVVLCIGDFTPEPEAEDEDDEDMYGDFKTWFEAIPGLMDEIEQALIEPCRSRGVRVQRVVEVLQDLARPEKTAPPLGEFTPMPWPTTPAVEVPTVGWADGSYWSEMDYS